MKDDVPSCRAVCPFLFHCDVVTKSQSEQGLQALCDKLELFSYQPPADSMDYLTLKCLNLLQQKKPICKASTHKASYFNPQDHLFPSFLSKVSLPGSTPQSTQGSQGHTKILPPQTCGRGKNKKQAHKGQALMCTNSGDWKAAEKTQAQLKVPNQDNSPCQLGIWSLTEKYLQCLY